MKERLIYRCFDLSFSSAISQILLADIHKDTRAIRAIASPSTFLYQFLSPLKITNIDKDWLLSYSYLERSSKNMNVSLTPELETLVNEKVKSGNYNSASEVVREALRLLKEQDELKRIRREELRREVMRGVTDIREGRFRTYESGEELAEQIIAEGKKRNLASKKKAK